MILRARCSSPRMITRNTNGVKWVRWQQPRRGASCTVSNVDEVTEINAQLRSLEEVVAAEDLVSRGLRSEAISLLERASEICRAMGSESALAQAAHHRLALVLYDDQRFSAAEMALTRRGGTFAGKTLPVEKAGLLLLSKAQLFQGKVLEAVESCSRAVELCEQDEDSTPDTDALGQALRQLGATQMLLDGAMDDAETSLLRAARLGSSGADQGKGLSVLAAFNASTGDDHRIEEAVDLWNEARATTKAAVKGLGATSDSPDSVQAGGDIGNDSAAISLSHASVLCSAAQGDLLLGRGTAKASEILTEALKIRNKLLPPNHPATAWTLALLGRCHVIAGEAVTAEGLLRAALDGFKTVGGEEGSANSISNVAGRAPVAAGPLLFSSPLHPFSKANALRAFSELLMNWEKRESEGGQVQRQAEQVESSLRLKPPGRITMHMLHLDDMY